MSGLGKLTVTLELENVKFQSALLKSDYEAQKFAKNFIQNMDRARNHAKEFADRSTQYLQTIEKATKNINKNSNFAFWSVIGGYAKSAGTNLIAFSNTYTELSNKLKLVTQNETHHARAMADVYDISLKTAQSTQATSSVYQTFTHKVEL